jgi:hypothetical protein
MGGSIVVIKKLVVETVTIKKENLTIIIKRKGA